VRRGNFMRNEWSVPCGEFLEEVMPLIKDHPYQSLIRSYGLDYGRQPAEWEAVFEKLKVEDATEELQLLSSATWSLAPKNPVGTGIWTSIWRHLDATAPDLEWVLLRTNKDQGDNRRKFARYLMDLSPFAPAAIAELVETDWAGMEPRAGEFEKTLGHHPAVLHALGTRYQALQRTADAERCFKKEIEVAPSLDASRSLAAVYLQGGDEAKWQETLEAFLRGEDVGLDHASVRVELAEHFMKLKKFDKAEPYAAAAAGSWAGWAMIAARDCYEGLEDWKNAELWHRRTSERYEDARIEWFFWCKRYQKGDAKAAEALAQRYIDELLPRATAADQEKMGIFYALCRKPREAAAAFQKSLKETNNPYDGLHIALLGMALKDGELRDSALLQVVQKGRAYQVAHDDRGLEVELGKEFRDLLELGAGAAPNPGVFDRLLDRAPDQGSRANAAFFIGRFLEFHRSVADANPYYEQCLKTGQSQKWNYLLAKEALRKSF